MEKLPRKIKIGRNWEFILINDKPHVINVGNSKMFRLDADLNLTKKLFELIDNYTTLTDLEGNMKIYHPNLEKSWVRNFLILLNRLKILQREEKIPTTLSKNYLIGLERQIDYFRDLNNGKTNYENQLKIKRTRIAILGLGNIAHYIIYSLISSGIGHLRCVDFDKVERRNIARQPIFRREDIGKFKCDVVTEYINKLNIGVKAEAVNARLSSPEDVLSVIHDVNLVVQCCDIPRFIVRRWITKACLQSNMPNLVVFSGRVGPFCIPYKTPCYICLEKSISREYTFYEPLADHIAESRITEYPELAVVSSVTSAIAGKEIVAHIIGLQPETYDHFFDVNPYTLRINSYPLKRESSCYACGKKK